MTLLQVPKDILNEIIKFVVGYDDDKTLLKTAKILRLVCKELKENIDKKNDLFYPLYYPAHFIAECHEYREIYDKNGRGFSVAVKNAVRKKLLKLDIHTKEDYEKNLEEINKNWRNLTDTVDKNSEKIGKLKREVEGIEEAYCLLSKLRKKQELDKELENLILDEIASDMVDTNFLIRLNEEESNNLTEQNGNLLYILGDIENEMNKYHQLAYIFHHWEDYQMDDINSMIKEDKIEYQTKVGYVRLFKVDRESCRPYGFYHGERVKFLYQGKQEATIIGVAKMAANYQNLQGENLWMHIDGDFGATYFDDGSYKKFIYQLKMKRIDK